MSRSYNIARNLALGVLAVSTSAYVYEGYRASIAPSKFHNSFQNMHFKPIILEDRVVPLEIQEEAMLRIFHMAGYFKPEMVWRDLSKLSIKNKEEVFESIMIALHNSGANQDDISKFNPKILRKNLLKIPGISTEDAQDYIIYVAQHAFNRAAGQERNELKKSDWMTECKDAYMENATDLGLVERIKPSESTYDEGWIAGASRVGFMARAIDYIQLLKSGIIVSGSSKALAGQRPLWAEIDGISPDMKEKLLSAHLSGSNIDDINTVLNAGDNSARTKEGIEYFKEIAQRLGIKLDHTIYVIFAKDDCPKGYFPGRHYPKYAAGETKLLTESLMSKDVMDMLDPEHKLAIVDTKTSHGSRPTTASTAKDAAEEFIQKILSGELGHRKTFTILFETNQPYVERQTIPTQREVDIALKNSGLWEKGYRVKVDGVGFRSKVDVAATHSEFGALLAEKWKDSATHSDRAPSTLMFQTRDKSGVTEPMPEYNAYKILSGNLAQLVFDSWLE